MAADARSLAFAALAALLVVSSCKDRADERAVASARVAPAPPPPAGLAVELFVPRPGDFWTLLRPLLGPVGTMLPQGPELALGAVLGLSPAVATALDLQSPLVGAAAVDGARARAVLGARLTRGDEFVANLTTGNTPTHRVEVEGEARVLVPLTAGSSTSWALAVIDDTLLAGARPDVQALGAYVARAVSRRAMPEPATAAIFVVPGEALRNSLAPMLRSGWDARRAFLERSLSVAQSEQGRVADLADPRVVLAGIDARVTALLDALRGARKLEARVIPEANRLVLDVEFDAGMPLLASFSDVPLDALNAAPDDAFVRLSLGRTDVAAPAELHAELRALFGARLSAEDARKVEQAVTLVEEGRGRTQAFAGRADGAFVWLGDVQDPKKLARGLDQSVALLQSKSVVAPFASVVGTLRVRPGRRAVRGLEEPAPSATIEVAPKPGARAPASSVPARRKLELVWAVRDRDFVVVLASDAVPVLESVLERRRRPANDVALLAPANSAAVAGIADLGGLPVFGASGPGKTLAFSVTQSPDLLHLRVAASPLTVASLVGMGMRH